LEKLRVANAELQKSSLPGTAECAVWAHNLNDGARGPGVPTRSDADEGGSLIAEFICEEKLKVKFDYLTTLSLLTKAQVQLAAYAQPYTNTPPRQLLLWPDYRAGTKSRKTREQTNCKT